MIPVDRPTARLPAAPEPPVASGTAPGAAARADALPELRQLRVGMRLEAQLMARLGSSGGQVEARLQLPNAPDQWSPPVRARIAGAPGERGATADTDPGAAATQPRRARVEILALRPAVVLRILDANQAPPGRAALAGAAAREWMSAQLRQHLPLARPLAATLSNLSTPGQPPLAAPVPGLAPGSTPAAATPGPGMRTAGMAPAAPGQPAATGTSQALAQVFDRLASARDLTDATRLPAILRQSGIWLESLLADAARRPDSEAGKAFESDLKAQLLRLAEQLRQHGQQQSPQAAKPPAFEGGAPRPPAAPETAGAPPRPAAATETAGAPPRPAAAPETANAPPRPSATPETASAPPPPADPEPLPTAARPQTLTQDVDGMIKQIVTRQLQTLDASAEQARWILDLPFRTPGGVMALEAEIAREQNADRASESCWTIRLRLEPPRIGPLRIDLTLRGERLHAALQTSTQDGAALLGQHLGELREQLVARDLEVASLHAGFNPRIVDQRAPLHSERPTDTPLLSERA